MQRGEVGYGGHFILSADSHRPLVKLRFESEFSALRGIVYMSEANRAPSEPKATTPQCIARGQEVRGHSASVAKRNCERMRSMESLKSYALKGVMIG